MSFNENSRVKIPAILHLTRMGYKYLSLKDITWDQDNNIIPDIFYSSITKLNPDIDSSEIRRLYDKLVLSLWNEDLWKEFYELLTAWEIKLFDFVNPEKNTYHVTTEYTCKNGEDEFRPDITLLINGMPLAFIEVKKPNNKEWILAERKRIDTRFQNKKFRKFVNITQLIVFSNNMEYDPNTLGQVEGAFYSSTSYGRAMFNAFKEDREVENIYAFESLSEIDEEVENFILKDNNITVIKHSPEFATNKHHDTPTNRMLTSLFNKYRFATLLKYWLAYVKEHDGLQKHIMRYPQYFATKAIEKFIDNGKKKGLIWHTQGSGKTALSFYNVKYLTDYFQKKSIIPKFYFIVDRLDLLTQASREFTSRWLKVHTVNSKEDLIKDFKSNKSFQNVQWKPEITVVNIQKFKENESEEFLDKTLYNLNSQRIYFIDEAHRGYKLEGSFLANLVDSDRDAIFIGLTGTPLIKWDSVSRKIFEWGYIHKYYYNSSIADWYTLKLIREEIETSYKMQLNDIVKSIQIEKGNISTSDIFCHPKYVDPMLEYIVTDFERSRIMLGDKTIWWMVVCDSSEQAKAMQDLCEKKYEWRVISALILHDIGSKDDRRDWVEKFKEGKIDLLFVYNMLLTGFDAKRLKKLYLWRVIRDHNLLQTLTRVNRPYKDFQYWFVVDFADISKEFDITNRAYFDELQGELGDEFESYSELFISKEEILWEIENIKDKLFQFDLHNAELFSRQISEIQDKKQILEIKKALTNAKNIYNIIRLLGHHELLEKIDFKKLSTLYTEVNNHLQLLNLKESLWDQSENQDLLNIALEDIIFSFRKISQEELVLAGELKDALKKTREAMGWNFDKKDKEFITLYEELKRLFNNKNLDEVSQEEMKQNISALDRIYKAITDLNQRNNRLKEKYKNDEKYVRLHKRLIEDKTIDAREVTIFEALLDVKQKADEKVLWNPRMLENENYFERLMSPIVIGSFESKDLMLDTKSATAINRAATNEYLNEYNQVSIW